MKKQILFYIFIYLCFAGNGFCLELLSNEKLASISGKAVTDNPAFNDPEVVTPFLTSEQMLRSFTHGNSNFYKTVAVDFYGKESVDSSGNIYYENFHVTPMVENIYYENDPYSGSTSDLYSNRVYSQFVMDGMLKAKVTVPEYYDNDPNIRSKNILISNERIELPAGSTGNFICSSQGHIYESGNIPEIETGFSIFPNRQTITVGSAEEQDLMILVPHGNGESTIWKPVVKNFNTETTETEYLVIPKGKKFIHIGLNHMIQRMDMNFTLRFSNTREKMKDMNGKISVPPEINQTLGAFTMNGGNTFINGGDVFITINDSL